ncbi:Cyclin family protein [Rhynchospora pubera]|uniref:Cyclin family protein n=1 Tax=Rhynchospora pubera TaxID=906938 RepID=A0AAV8CWH6_9POAL|nr:Cyclin family protein [Rhynchospora pubera]
MAPHGDQSYLSSTTDQSPYRREEGGQIGASWYYSRKDIEENSPSRLDGIDLKKETYLRKSYCTFLQDLGMRLKVPQVTIATAIVFCHRFFLRQSHAKNDRRTIATVCMFLAGKVEETPRPLKDVILVSYEIINKKDADAVQRIKQREVYEQQKELILLGERVVLSTLGFDLNVHHPYKPLVEAIKKFHVAQNALAQVAWNFVNDGLRTSLCLQFKPHHIAAGAIFLAAKFLKVKLPSEGDKVWWQEFDVTPRQLEEVSNQMLELYEQNRAAPSQGGAAANEEAEGSSASGAHPHQPRTPVKAPPSSEGGDPASASHHHHPSTNGHPTPPTMRHHSSSSGPPHGKSDEQQLQQESNHTAPTTDSGPSRFASSSLASDAMPRINADKVKALVEKRRKSKLENSRKVDVLDEDDLIERELEHGVELAISNKKGKGGQVENTKNSYYGDDKGEEGELSIDSQDMVLSPEPGARKKRPASPGGTGKVYGNSSNDVRLKRFKCEGQV